MNDCTNDEKEDDFKFNKQAQETEITDGNAATANFVNSVTDLNQSASHYMD